MSQLKTAFRIGLLICVIGRTQSQDIHLPAEKGQPTTLECSFSSPATSVTWKLLDASKKEVILTTCSTTACTDQLPQNFTGHVAGSAGVYKSTLDIARVTVDKTKFKCLTDAGVLVAHISLEVYVVASVPSCRQSLVLNEYVDVICVTDNVYPSFRGVLHRRQPGNLVFDQDASSCSLGALGSGYKGDRKGQCTLRVLFRSLQEINTFYFEIFPMVWNDTVVDKPVVSRDITLSLNLPNVVIHHKDCPVGPGVYGRNILKGTTATCKCDIIESGLVSGKVRWFKKDETVVGDEDSWGRYSILTVAYNASDPDAEYDCRAVNPSATYYHLPYKPNFTSSASGNLISGLAVMMALGVAYMGFTFQTA